MKELRLKKRVYQIRGGCVLCMTCLNVCPCSAVIFSYDIGLPRIDPNLCSGCGRCKENCPGEAIEAVAEEPNTNGEAQ